MPERSNLSSRSHERRVFLGLPAFNEAEAIGPLFGRVKHSKQSLVASDLISDLRVIFLNDGSTDDTVDRVRENATDLDVLIVSPPSNRGLGHALEAIFTVFLEQSTEHDVLVVMDADDTHDPAQITELLQAMDSCGCDVVVASRYQPGSKTLGVPPIRQILSIGFALLVKGVLPIRGVRDYSCGYRAYSRKAVEGLAQQGVVALDEPGFAAMPEVLIRLRRRGLRFCEIPLQLAYDRRLTQSKMRSWQNSRRLLRCVVKWRFSQPPTVKNVESAQAAMLLQTRERLVP